MPAQDFDHFVFGIARPTYHSGWGGPYGDGDYPVTVDENMGPPYLGRTSHWQSVYWPRFSLCLPQWWSLRSGLNFARRDGSAPATCLCVRALGSLGPRRRRSDNGPLHSKLRAMPGQTGASRLQAGLCRLGSARIPIRSTTQAMMNIFRLTPSRSANSAAFWWMLFGIW